MDKEKCNAIFKVLLDSAKETLDKVTESAKETMGNVVDKAEEVVNDLELKATGKTVEENLIKLEKLAGELSEDYKNSIKSKINACISSKDQKGLDEINQSILKAYKKVEVAKMLISEAGIV